MSALEQAKRDLGDWLVADYRRNFYCCRLNGEWEYRLRIPFGGVHVGMNVDEAEAIKEALRYAKKRSAPTADQPLGPETELQINALLELSAYDVTLDPYDPREVTKSAAAHMRKLSEENATLSTERFDAMSRVVALQKERDAAQRDKFDAMARVVALQNELTATKAELAAAIKNADAECKLRLETQAELERADAASAPTGTEP